MKPLCKSMEDHEWVYCDGDDHGFVREGEYCVICGVSLEEAPWIHADREADAVGAGER